jgi:Protein of unknown function (DUF1552)
MFITKKTLSRRVMLRGLGASLALPFLDAMVPALTALSKTQGNVVHRFGVMYGPNGIIMADWTPVAEGSGFQFMPIMNALEPFRDQLIVLSGLASTPPPGLPGAHARASTRFLTDVPPKPTEGADLAAGISVDQLLAKELRQYTQFGSLELAIESTETAGACDVGYACPYTSTISWSSANTPLPMENNPRIVFERLFGDAGSTNSKARLARIAQNRSLLDSVIQEADRLEASLGSSDQIKLAEYLEAVRDAERRIQKAEEQSNKEIPVVDHPAGIPLKYDDHVKLMLDLEVLAYQTDLTRVITFMMGREFSGVTYPQIGVPDAHHPISHHQNDPEKIAKVAKINTYHVGFVAYLLDRLRSTPDGDGSLLDHTTMLFGAGMGDSNAHDPTNLPIVLAGGGAGTMKGGRHIRYPKSTPLANLHLTLLDQFGIHVDRIGDSTTPLDDRQLFLG